MTKWLIQITKENQTILTKQLSNYARITKYLQAGKKPGTTIRVVATYGTHTDGQGKTTKYKNEGTYYTHQKAMQAMIAFEEVSKEWGTSTK
jgi:hypothetical protein